MWASGGMADARDLKSLILMSVWVRIPPFAPLFFRVMPCDRMVVLDGSETGLAQHHSFLLWLNGGTADSQVSKACA